MTLKRGTRQDAAEVAVRIGITDQSEEIQVEVEARNVGTADAIVEAEIDVVEIAKLTVMTEKIGTEVGADKKDDQNQDPNPETENLDTSK